MSRIFLLLSLLAMAAVSVIGAEFDGAWIISTHDGDGRPVKADLTFRTEAGALKATLKAGSMRHEIGNVARENGQVRFEIPWEDRTVRIQLALAGEELKGEWKTGDDVGTMTGARAAAGMAGVWKLTATRPSGEPAAVEMELKNDGGTWRGTMRSGETGPLALQDLKAGEDAVQFTADTSHGPVQIRMKLQDGLLKGTWSLGNDSSGAIEGRR
ncbi:MAG: hypothetical protein IT163_04355 [Bryobacterales bacterium]|nr:hypothetical protein [Bryobacterales bacterium]